MIPGLLEFSGNNHNKRQCQNVTEGRETVDTLSDIIFDFIASSQSFGCPLPCERNVYNYNLNHIHENSLSEEQPKADAGCKFVYMSFYYSTFIIEQQVETLIYDVGGFLAAAGGNLGLCLGFSCLSVLFTFWQWSTIAIQRIKKYIIF